MPAPAPAVEVQGLCVRYAHENVVEDVTFTIEQGDFVAIVGPNGSGKSTLLRAVMSLVPAHCGDVRILGEPLRSFRAWRRVGYVPQKAAHMDERLFPATAFEVAMLGRVAHRGLFRRLGPDDRRRAREMLRVVGMDGHADRRLGELSGGQRQRVLLAKALASEPAMLVLDEPTTGVDPAARQGFYELLDHLNHDDGITILLVSHDLQTLRGSAHRVLALNKRLLFDGTAEELEARGGPEAVYGKPITHDHGGHAPHVAGL